MQGYRFGVKIGSSALGLDSRCGEVGSFLNEAGSMESNGVVSFLKYEHTDYFFISVDNEVPAKFVAVFVVLNELLRGQF